MDNKNNVVIRDAVRADIENVGDLLSDNHQTTYKGLIDDRLLAFYTHENSQAKMEAYWLTPGNEMLVAEEEDGRFLGYVAGRPSPDVLGAFWLEFLDVDENARGRGLARRLIWAMGARAAEQGYPQMVIDIIAGNDNAEQIYEHLGAKRIREYYQDLEGFPTLSRLLMWDDMSVFGKKD
jgi:GNAT superfamily N-acetyltransferase